MADGLAIAIDGNDAIMVDQATMATIQIDHVTMAAWIKAEAGGGGGGGGASFEADHGIIMNKENVYEYGINTNRGLLQAAFGTGGDANWHSPNGGCWRYWGNVVIPAHEWVHTAMSFDGTNQYHWLNGALVEQQACGDGPSGQYGGILSANTMNFYIGQRDQTRYTSAQGSTANDAHGHSEWRGDIDEAMLFSEAISADQVHFIYTLQYRTKRGTASSTVMRLPGTPDVSSLPSSLVGFWPLDMDGTDLGPHGMTGQDPNPLWVAGKYNLALNFDGGDGFVITDPQNALASISAGVTMVAYVRPAAYEVCADRGIIMSKEGAFEYGIESNTGAMQGAKDTGCWRWFGNVRLGLYDWTQTAVSFDGVDEVHWVNGIEMERDSCPGAISPSYEPLRIGARGDCSSCNQCGAASNAPACLEANSAPPVASWSQFVGDIDETMLFSAALTSAEMSSIHQASYRTGADPLPTDGEANVDMLKRNTGATQSGKTLVGFWLLDGDVGAENLAGINGMSHQDSSGSGLHMTATNAQFVTGLFGQAFRFTGNDMLIVDETNGVLDADFVTMAAWVRPIHYDVAADRGIIMNKESSYEMGLEDRTGNLQGAFASGSYAGGHEENGDFVYDEGSTGCWRWWGHIRIPLHEWTHIGVQYDGTHEKHYVNGMMAETGTKPTPLLTAVLPSHVDRLLPQARAPATPPRTWPSTSTRPPSSASGHAKASASATHRWPGRTARAGTPAARRSSAATSTSATPPPPTPLCCVRNRF